MHPEMGLPLFCISSACGHLPRGQESQPDLLNSNNMPHQQAAQGSALAIAIETLHRVQSLATLIKQCRSAPPDAVSDAADLICEHCQIALDAAPPGSQSTKPPSHDMRQGSVGDVLPDRLAN